MGTYASGSGQGNINIGSGDGAAPAGAFSASFTLSSDPPLDWGDFQGPGGTRGSYTISGLARNISPNAVPRLVFFAAGNLSPLQIGAPTLIALDLANGIYSYSVTAEIDFPPAAEIEPVVVWLENPSGQSSLIGSFAIEGT